MLGSEDDMEAIFVTTVCLSGWTVEILEDI